MGRSWIRLNRDLIPRAATKKLIEVHLRPFNMNPEKLKQLQAQVRIGGKGTARRKKKVVHRTATTDDKKLQSSLKKLAVNNIPGIEEVNMIRKMARLFTSTTPRYRLLLPLTHLQSQVMQKQNKSRRCCQAS